MARPLWVVDLLKRHFKWRFFGAELTKVPILGTVMEKWLFNGHKTGDALFYLPQDRVFINAQIEEPENVIVPSDVVRFFITQSNYHFIMNECICRTANHCQDFPHDYGCLFLGEGVLDINSDLGHLVTREEALAHEAHCQELGLVHLIGRDKIDAVWMGVPSSTKLMTICNCCACCCLFKFIPNLAPKLRAKLTRMPGIHLEVTSDCIGCGACTEDVCFIDVIHVVKGRAVIGEECRGCGKCVPVCPQSAIKLIIDDEDFILSAISRLQQAVDVK
jgi:hypothetical protein